VFAKTEAPAKAGTFESLLGKGIEIKGTVKSKGSLRIEGTAEGNVECDGDITIGETAVMSADVTAQNVTIGGTVCGTVRCYGRLELLPTARVRGDIIVNTLVVSEGAVFSGTTLMGEEAKDKLSHAGSQTAQPGNESPAATQTKPQE